MSQSNNTKNVKYGFEHQDLEVLHLVNKKVAQEKAQKAKKQSGAVEVKKKHVGDAKMWKLENEMDNLKIETVSKSISKTIQSERLKKGLKQKDLANKINVTPNVIQQYESGSCQTDIKILLKLEKVLKCKLTGKGFTK